MTPFPHIQTKFKICQIGQDEPKSPETKKKTTESEIDIFWEFWESVARWIACIACAGAKV